MNPPPLPCRLVWLVSLVALVAASSFGSTSALALSKDGGGLSAALSELTKPSVRSQSPAQQAKILGVAPSGPGSLLREGNRVLVSVRFEHGAIAGLEGLKAIGATPISSSQQLQTVTAAAAPAILHQVAALRGVASVTASRAPILYGSDSTSLSGDGSCEGGSVISEGLTQLKVDREREAFGLRGAGVTVGVLSDSFDTATEAADESGPIATHAAEDIISGDLPGPAGSCSGQQAGVDVLDDGAIGGEPADEGRAMLQIVHDLAPHSSLAFATAFRSEESFAQNIERLAAPVAAGGADAKVIVDDVAYFEEPFFQDGPVAAAINKVNAEGVTYLTAAGNNNLFEGGNEIASWEAPEYRDAAGCPPAIQGLAGFNGTHCMDFDPGTGTDRTFGITIAPGATLTLDLQWAEPWNGVNTDLDAFLLNAKGELLTGSVEENTGKAGTQRPLEIVQWQNASSSAQTVQLAINRYSGSTSPRLKFALLENGFGVTKTEYPRSEGGDVVGPTIFGHAGDLRAIAVAAAPYSNSSEPERYSSRGPVTHYFEAVEGIGPAAPLPSPEAIAKPDVTATDCGATTFFAHRYDGVVWRFCGTSAAAPHAAAVAALLRQGNPAASVQQIRASLIETAAPVGSFSSNAVGSGLVDALAAVTSLPEPLDVEDGPSTLVSPLEAEPEAAAPTSTMPTSTTPPNTFFKRHPPKTVRTRLSKPSLAFRFGSDQAVQTFLCKVDRTRFQRCGFRFSRRFAVGHHAVRVKARGMSGLVDSSPAVFRFRVKRIG